MTPELVDHALRVAAALDDKSRWTQGAFARTACNKPVNFDDPRAVAWCPVGHGLRIVPSNTRLTADLDHAYSAAFGCSIAADNDGRYGRALVRKRLLVLAKGKHGNRGGGR